MPKKYSQNDVMDHQKLQDSSPVIKENRSASATTHQRLGNPPPISKVFSIPTVINGVITKQFFSKQTPHLGQSKKKKPTHKVVLTGDIHLKVFSTALQSVLPSECETLSVVKPEACSDQLSKSITNTILQLTKDDILVIGSGTNDYRQGFFKSTLLNFKEFLPTLSHTNVLLLGIPYRYDLPNIATVNSQILKINRKLSKLAQILPNTSYLNAHNDSKLFTRHGLHRNKLGKQIIIAQISAHVSSYFKGKIQTSIPLAWHEPNTESQDVKQSENPDANPRQAGSRNSSRLRRTPITRSDDFLW